MSALREAKSSGTELSKKGKNESPYDTAVREICLAERWTKTRQPHQNQKPIPLNKSLSPQMESLAQRLMLESRANKNARRRAGRFQQTIDVFTKRCE
jgi:hypothetical protein